MSNLTLGSLFDGSGGFPLGGMLAGITPVWASEIEPFPIRVTTKRLPFMKHYGNVSEMDGGKVEPVDIITFGSPCQDMSVAGKRAGLEGSRSNLFYEAVRIIKEMRKATGGKYPRWACWENVPGAFSSSGGDDFRCVLESLCGVIDETVSIPKPKKWTNAGEILGDGYSIAWRVLDAQFWGVPQRRKRIYLVADFTGGCAGKVLFESEGLSGYSPQGFRSRQAAPGGSADCSGAAGVGFDGYNAKLTDDKSATLGANCGLSTGRNGVVLNDQGGNRMDVTEDVTCTLRAEAHHPPCIMEVFDNHSQDTRFTGPVDKVQPLSATMGSGGNNQPFVAEILSEPRLWNGDHIAPTLTKQNADGGQRMPDKGNFNCVLQPFGICSKDSNAMKSTNPHSGVYAADTSRTLDTSGGNPACNQGGIAVVCVDMGGGKSGCGVNESKAPTLACTHGGEPAVCVAIEGNGSRPSHRGGGFKEGDTMYTLNSVEQHAVAYSMTTGSFPNVAEEKAPPLLARDFKDATVVTEPFCGSSHNAFYLDTNAPCKPCIEEDVPSAIAAKEPCAVAQDDSGYTVRRLTPTECARLQGFPDWWCDALRTEKPTDEDVYFWYKVFKTYAEINGSKPKTDKQIRTWLQDPSSDSAEYKMWGNGVALPCVFFVLSGIVWAAKMKTAEAVF